MNYRLKFDFASPFALRKVTDGDDKLHRVDLTMETNGS